MSICFVSGIERFSNGKLLIPTGCTNGIAWEAKQGPLDRVDEDHMSQWDKLFLLHQEGSLSP